MKIKFHPRQRALAAALIALFLYACDAHGQSDIRRDPGDLALIQGVMKLVQQKYVEPVADDKLVGNALRGMLTGLDPHSDYMDEPAFQRMRSDTRGEFGGVGLQLTLTNGVPTVIAPIDDTPAAKAGINPGDRIIKIDDQATEGMPLDDVVTRVRGRAGSPVRMQLLRDNQPPFNVTLVRSVIHITSVKAQLEKNKLGYIRISQFTETTQDEFSHAIASLKQGAGGHLNGLVLDLRNDPGGLLEAAIDVSGDLLDSGVIVTTRGREDDDNHVYNTAAGGDRLRGIPVVVLINGASASASEIVAGALQDHHRATVMGNRSFGKGSVQTIIPLNGHGAVRLTTARYYTPAGRSIQDGGIVPDVVVGAGKDEQVANAPLLREGDLPRALRNTGNLDTSAAATGPTDALAGADAAPIAPSFIGTDKDGQLQAALRFLQHQATTGAPAAD